MRKFQSHVLFLCTVALAAVIFLDGLACRASAQEASGIFIQDKSLAVSVALNSNGTQVAIGTIGAARVWKTASPKEPPLVLAHNCDVQRVFFTPDDQSLITVCNDGAIRIWSLLDRTQTPTLFRGNDDITDASMTRDGMLLATASWKRAVQVWNLKKLDSPVTYDPKIRLAFQSVAFSPSGERMVASVDDNALIWDVEEHPVDPFQIVRAPSKKERVAIFSLALKTIGTLAAGLSDNTIHVWFLPEVELNSHIYYGHSGQVTTVLWNPNRNELASAGEDGTVRLWDTAILASPKAILLKHPDVSRIAYSGDGEFLASGGGDGVHVWNLKLVRAQEPWVPVKVETLKSDKR